MTDAETGTIADDIERTLDLRAPVERVWRAITDPAELILWFPQGAEWDLRPGGEGTFHWDEHGDYQIRVEAVEEPRYLAWRWGLEIQPGPDVRESPTLVEWWLEPTEDGGTLLRLRESGFAFESHRTENDKGWAEELGKLVFLIEGGQ